MVNGNKNISPSFLWFVLYTLRILKFSYFLLRNIIWVLKKYLQLCVCVYYALVYPRKFVYWKLNPPWDGIWRWGFLGGGQSLHEGINAIIKRACRRAFSVFCFSVMWEHSICPLFTLPSLLSCDNTDFLHREDAALRCHLETREQTLISHQTCWQLDLYFLRSETVRNQFLFFINNTVSGILL